MPNCPTCLPASPPAGSRVARLVAVVSGFLLAGVAQLAAAQTPQTPAPPTAEPLAIANARVVDVDAGEARPPMNILIENGRVLRLDPASTPIPDRFRVVDAGGRFALPGLIDSHVHYVDPDTYGPLMLAHGVAVVRDLGNDTRTILDIRDRLNAGELLGPRMIATGAIIDGNPPIWPFSEPVENAEQARAAVDKLADAGVDQIKLYSGLSPEAYHAAVERARERGLLAVGHVPVAVPLADAAGAGHGTIEHLTGFDVMLAQLLEPDSDIGMDFRLRAVAIARSEEISDERLLEAMEPIVRARTAQVPTLVVFEGVAAIAERTEPHPMDKYVKGELKAFWSAAGYDEWGRTMRAQIPAMHRLVGLLHDRGVPILAGTDLANPNVHAGWSLHHELQLLVACGLSEAEALRAATTVPADLFGLEGVGRLTPGAEASLLLLDADPLEDIANTLAIDAVVTRGVHRSREDLDALLADAEAAAGQPLTVAVEDDGFEGLAMPGLAVARGSYAMKFGEWDAGGEEFRITRSEDGFYLAARTSPRGGGQPPALVTIETDASLNFVRATRRELREGSETATYEIEQAEGGRVLVAKLGEETQRVPIPDDGVISGPVMSSDAMVLLPLELEVGEQVTRESVSFGLPTWRVSSSANRITRLENARVTLPTGEEVEALVFRQQVEVEGMGEFDITTRITPGGLIVSLEMKMPFGTLTCELVELD